MSVPPTIVFDLDGTLVETIGDIAATLNFMLAGEGCEPLAEEDVRGMVGMGARVLLERGLSASQHPVTPAKLERLYARFVEHYAANIATKSHPLPGLADALDMAEAAGCRLAVCTNKLEGLARKLLDELGLSHRFAAIVGGDTFPFQKPDPRVLLATIARAEGEPSVALMVGDSKTDVDTARAADIPVLVVDFGYTEIPPADLGGDALISSWHGFWNTASRLLAERAAV
jgi:phosphoglycolate phosphatase